MSDIKTMDLVMDALPGLIYISIEKRVDSIYNRSRYFTRNYKINMARIPLRGEQLGQRAWRVAQKIMNKAKKYVSDQMKKI